MMYRLFLCIDLEPMYMTEIADPLMHHPLISPRFVERSVSSAYPHEAIFRVGSLVKEYIPFVDTDREGCILILHGGRHTDVDEGR